MNKPIYIYVLKHPLTEEVRYVGKTNNLKKRLESHLAKANEFKGRRKVINWVQSIVADGMQPIIESIEECLFENWAEREKYWISYYKSIGSDLCNLTDGGESNYGYVYSDELKEVRRKARQGWKYPKEVTLKIAKALSKKIVCVEDKIVFNSMKQATDCLNVPKATFHRKFHKGEKINGKTYTWYTSLTPINKP